MGGAFNSGRPDVTDSFASVFWFADALGTLALFGTEVVCRQTLIGGSYGLLALRDNATVYVAADGGSSSSSSSSNGGGGSSGGGAPHGRGVRPDMCVWPSCGSTHHVHASSLTGVRARACVPVDVHVHVHAGTWPFCGSSCWVRKCCPCTWGSWGSGRGCAPMRAVRGAGRGARCRAAR